MSKLAEILFRQKLGGSRKKMYGGKEESAVSSLIFESVEPKIQKKDEPVTLLDNETSLLSVPDDLVNSATSQDAFNNTEETSAAEIPDGSYSETSVEPTQGTTVDQLLDDEPKKIEATIKSTREKIYYTVTYDTEFCNILKTGGILNTIYGAIGKVLYGSDKQTGMPGVSTEEDINNIVGKLAKYMHILRTGEQEIRPVKSAVNPLKDVFPFGNGLVVVQWRYKEDARVKACGGVASKQDCIKMKIEGQSEYQTYESAIEQAQSYSGLCYTKNGKDRTILFDPTAIDIMSVSIRKVPSEYKFGFAENVGDMKKLAEILIDGCNDERFTKQNMDNLIRLYERGTLSYEELVRGSPHTGGRKR